MAGVPPQSLPNSTKLGATRMKKMMAAIVVPGLLVFWVIRSTDLPGSTEGVAEVKLADLPMLERTATESSLGATGEEPPDEVSRGTLTLLQRLGGNEDFGQIKGVFSMEDFILVSDALATPHVAVISRQTSEVLSREGGHGQGPGEFSSPQGFYPVEGKTSAAWLHDFSNRRLSLSRSEPTDMR